MSLKLSFATLWKKPSCFYLGSCSVSHDLYLMTICEGWNINGQWNGELCLSTQLQHDRLKQCPHYWGQRLKLSKPSFIPSFVPKASRYLNSSTWSKLIPNLEGAFHLYPLEKYSLGLRGTDYYPSYLTLGCKLPQCTLKVIAWMCQENHIICI